MFYRFLLITITVLVFSSCVDKTKSRIQSEKIVSHYYFIRHAEKDRSNPENKNPDLTNEGLQRAENWSIILGDVKFDAVLSTNYTRTIKTATPSATKNNLEITIYNPNDLDIPSFIKENNGKNVLVVGHSNTTPQLVNKIIGKDIYQEIDDYIFGDFYHITITNGYVSNYNLTTN